MKTHTVRATQLKVGDHAVINGEERTLSHVQYSAIGHIVDVRWEGTDEEIEFWLERDVLGGDEEIEVLSE